MNNDIRKELGAITVLVTELHKLHFGGLKTEPKIKLRHKFTAEILSGINKKPRRGG